MTTLAPTRLVDAVWRLALLLAYRGLRAWWFLRRPHHRGAVAALWHGGRVLLVRTSYRRCWCFPGGGIGRDEPPEAAVARELREEIGLAVAPSLRLAQVTTHHWENRDDEVHLFEGELAAPPRLVLDNREIVTARFFAPEELAGIELPPHVRAYLDRRSAQTEAG
jgi:8-oxo-dGTP pyrophosphatase MutT (NUDIX family)